MISKKADVTLRLPAVPTALTEKYRVYGAEALAGLPLGASIDSSRYAAPTAACMVPPPKSQSSLEMVASTNHSCDTETFSFSGDM